MNNIPASAKTDTQIRAAETVLLAATQQSSDPALPRAQRQRANAIKKDLIKHLGQTTAVILITLVTTAPVFAQGRWVPAPERGRAQSSIGTGRR